MMRYLLSVSLLAIGLLACGQAETSKEKTAKAIDKTVETSSRISGYSKNKNVYFGDLHIHTKNSFDAYIFNVRSTPDDVYRFAKGETVRHPAGYDITIGGEPLDFVAATDHGAYMGILPAMNNPVSPLSKLPMAKEMFGTDPELIVRAFNKIGGSVRSGKPSRPMNSPLWMGAGERMRALLAETSTVMLFLKMARQNGFSQHWTRPIPKTFGRGWIVNVQQAETLWRYPIIPMCLTGKCLR